MDSDELQPLVQVLKALADESRLRILGALATGEWSVRDLAELLHLKEPTVSHHLAKLQEFDLVQMRPVGTTHLYRLNNPALLALNRTLLTRERLARVAGPGVGEPPEHKVLRTFLDGERLLKIPESHTKRLVILKWLLGQFAAGQQYPEAAVNEIIARHHPDTATLRRELIMNKLMARANGVYWRIDPAPEAAE